MLPLKRRLLPFFKWGILFIIIIFVVGLGIGIFTVYKISASVKLTPVWIWDIAKGNTKVLRQTENRTNIVILGIGGKDHESGDLTDTIIVVSIGLLNKDVALISIPRDIWVPTLKDKVNSAFHYGEEKAKGKGLILAKASVEEITGLPMHYVALMDFSGFKKIIDVVGGVDVDIGVSFTDNEFPVPGKEADECDGDPKFACRYEAISFAKGTEHMDGDRALKYVRSRHAEGDSGTDFSRSERQQAVLLALKQKFIEKKTWTDLHKIQSIYAAIQEAITTDMYVGEALLLGRIVTPEPKLRSIKLDQDEPEKNKKGLLINPPLWKYDGRWVLAPKHDEDYSQIHTYIACVVKNTLSCDNLVD